MSMTYQKAHEIMSFLRSCGVNAKFEINVYDGDNLFLFDIETSEEWEEA